MTGKKETLWGMLSAMALGWQDNFRAYNKRGLEVHPHQLEGDKRAKQLRGSRRMVRFSAAGARIVRKLKGTTVKPDRGLCTRRGKRVLPYQEDHARRLFKKARLLAKTQKRKEYKADCQLLRKSRRVELFGRTCVPVEV